MKTISEAVAEKTESIIKEGKVLRDEPMNLHTTMKVGGPADLYVIAENEDELAELLRYVTADGIEHLLIGNGSNFLVVDEGYPGMIIQLGDSFDYIEKLDETHVTAGAAKRLSSVSTYLIGEGLAGFEFASGIPGSVGGAMFMNAGAYGGEMKDIVRKVRLMKPDGSEIVERTGEEMGFSYRNSAIQQDGMIVLSATFELTADDSETIAGRVLELQNKRNSKQPVEYPSAGSTFKRPVGGYAAALIDEAGLRGCSIGGAQVSEKHTGFVINKGGATAEDVLELMRHIQKTVYERSGIMLEPEVRIIGGDL